MITYTTDYNTAELEGNLLRSIYCVVRGLDENGVSESIGRNIVLDPPIVIADFDSLTKEDVDAIVKPLSQYSEMEEFIANSISSRTTTVKEFSWNVQPPPPPPEVNPVPQAVTPLQIRAAINMLGLRELVEGYVASLDQTSQDAWEYATIIERSNPILVNGAIAMGKTPEELDQVFILADSLV